MIIFMLGVVLTIAIGWLIVGVWMILPFAGLEVSLFALLMYLVSRHTYRSQEITLTAQAITVKNKLGSRESSSSINRMGSFLQVVETERDWNLPVLYLVNENQRINIGAFLNLKDRQALRNMLKQEGIPTCRTYWWKTDNYNGTNMTEKYDVVLFGATSFVGKIAAHYLAQRPDKNFTWAIAARSQQKLDSLLADLPANKQPDHISADVNDYSSLVEMCKRAKVIISTVGPYALYGEPVIKACIETGSDYVDLTGEPQWIKRMLDQYGKAANEAGVRLVNCCGFDSIPSDLGVYFLQQNAEAKYGESCQRVAMRVHRVKGGASGGTVASMLNLLEEIQKDPSLRKVIASPYALCPDGHPLKAYQPSLKSAKFDQETNKWMAPFIMEAINSRIVHRSNALLDAHYGKRFVYSEAMLTGKGVGGAWRATAMALGLGGFMVAASVKTLRGILQRNWLPKPGEGPSPMEQQNGMFDIRFYGYTESGKRLVAKVTGDRDPGYGSTAKMLSEAAICLAQNEHVRKKSGGFYTPASVFENHLFEPLIQHAGLTFEIKD